MPPILIYILVTVYYLQAVFVFMTPRNSPRMATTEMTEQQRVGSVFIRFYIQIILVYLGFFKQGKTTAKMHFLFSVTFLEDNDSSLHLRETSTTCVGI